MRRKQEMDGGAHARLFQGRGESGRTSWGAKMAQWRTVGWVEVSQVKRRVKNALNGTG